LSKAKGFALELKQCYFTHQLSPNTYIFYANCTFNQAAQTGEQQLQYSSPTMVHMFSGMAADCTRRQREALLFLSHI
jgi:hypothetical protein